ncbi:MAG: VOC family protein [Caldilineaceae bacterium]
MSSTPFDHIVIGAASIQQGVAYLEQTLGVTLPAGGEHPRMGTHNHLMRLSDRTFFEIIAINPAAAAPNRPRWFGLDDPFVQSQLQRQPRLLTWVVNSTDIHAIHAQSLVPLGEITPQVRGNLEWLITIPTDGHLPGAGLIPTVIQWQVADHPAARMADLGCTLAGLHVYHPYPDWYRQSLAALNLADEILVHPLATNQPPYMVAQFETANGPKALSSQIP